MRRKRVYKIDNVLKGKYKVIVSFIGYKDLDDVLIEDDKVYTINASLSISPINGKARNHK